MRLFLLLALMVTAGALASTPRPPIKCGVNLCGGDSACWCHEIGTNRRCWTTEADCLVDRSCCVADGGCQGMVKDTCAIRTSAERAKRDPKDGGP